MARKAILSPVRLYQYAGQVSAALASASIAWPLVFFIFLYGVGSTMKHVVGWLGVISLLILLRRPSDWLRAPGIHHWLAISCCLLLPMLASLVGAEQLDRGVSGLGRIGLYVLAAYCLMCWVPQSRQEPSTALALLAVVMMFVLDGYLQLFTGVSVSGQRPISIPEGYKITGPMGMNYGESLAILSPLVFEALRRHAGRLPVLWICVPLLCGAVVISASRNSLLLFALAGATYFLIAWQTLNTRQRLSLLWGVAGSIALGVFLPVMALPHLLERIAALGGLLHGDSTIVSRALSFRPELWQAAGQVFLENPINGVGMRGSGDAMLPFLQQSPLYEALPIQDNWYPHLMIIEVAADLGIIGLIGYGLFLWYLINICFRSSGLGRAFSLVALLAFFPASTSLSFFSFRITLLGWPALAFAVGIYARRQIRPELPVNSSSGKTDRASHQE